VTKTNADRLLAAVLEINERLSAVERRELEPIYQPESAPAHETVKPMASNANDRINVLEQHVSNLQGTVQFLLAELNRTQGALGIERGCEPPRVGLPFQLLEG
jgi:hypothetical protein